MKAAKLHPLQRNLCSLWQKLWPCVKKALQKAHQGLDVRLGMGEVNMDTFHHVVDGNCLRGRRGERDEKET